ncbi:MAG: sodium ion-translocating decarboxylase subunit beta [Clostridiaceae bacterium]|nr:sodium ion-translocating decarboxylase subunit beta [Clostridiaceae bacterium]
MKKLKPVIIAALTVICALAALVSAFSGPLLSKYLTYKFNINAKDAGSIGIIGGADGPTAVFVSGHAGTYWVAAVFALLAILGVIYLLKTRFSKAE